MSRFYFHKRMFAGTQGVGSARWEHLILRLKVKKIQMPLFIIQEKIAKQSLKKLALILIMLDFPYQQEVYT